MFTHEDLHFIRTDELEFLARRLNPGCSVLEIGAGTGYQAQGLARRGFDVCAIDLPNSAYSASRVFPVTDYDGRTIPFPEATFDTIFSSNVLEHVPDLPVMLAEMRRVLKPGGYAVHAMPSPAWRLWTTLAGPIDCVPFAAATLLGSDPSLPADRSTAVSLARGIARRLVPLPHGEGGNAFTELVTFSKRSWTQLFESNGFMVVRAAPMNLFYTGRCVFGRRLSIETRRRLAMLLGSACYVYEVRPR